jgi:transposase
MQRDGIRESRIVWAERVARWRESGLSTRSFAELEGVKPSTLSFWKWKLGSLPGAGHASGRGGGRRRPESQPRFVELVPSPGLNSLPLDSSPSAMELSLPGGYQVRLQQDFAPDALGRLLDVLGARS